jgi:hypothetical protein
MHAIMLAVGWKKVYSVWVQMGMIAKISGKGKYSSLLILGLLLDQTGDRGLGWGVPVWS